MAIACSAPIKIRGSMEKNHTEDKKIIYEVNLTRLENNININININST